MNESWPFLFSAAFTNKTSWTLFTDKNIVNTEARFLAIHSGEAPAFNFATNRECIDSTHKHFKQTKKQVA